MRRWAASPPTGCARSSSGSSGWRRSARALADNIKDIFAEAKSAGFDVKVVRQIISIRKKEPAEVEEQETLLDLYRRALGM